jgi:hypothetical protein
MYPWTCLVWLSTNTTVTYHIHLRRQPIYFSSQFLNLSSVMARKPSIPEILPWCLRVARRVFDKSRKILVESQRFRVSPWLLQPFLISWKIKSYQLEVDYIKTYRDGLYEAKLSEKINDDEYKTELNAILDDFCSAQEDLQLVERERFILEEWPWRQNPHP